MAGPKRQFQSTSHSAAIARPQWSLLHSSYSLSLLSPFSASESTSGAAGKTSVKRSKQPYNGLMASYRTPPRLHQQHQTMTVSQYVFLRLRYQCGTCEWKYSFQWRPYPISQERIVAYGGTANYCSITCRTLAHIERTQVLCHMTRAAKPLFQVHLFAIDLSGRIYKAIKKWLSNMLANDTE
ncbi:hypothetical protein EDB82DRAFT_349081 [Fusarium venenatum]|uniref:uncharacterized protein n=1 Tax=Fusarium venenatum TaxID=56646 RepID=UPI001D92E8C9|nr:hypothetical protein EDB82DRAFT_349081 [Fusarium venenatum]